MFVYKITNLINQKIYIGITNNPKRRWQNHCCNKDSLIGRAIRKYGRENFAFEVLFSGLTIEEASHEEIRLIKELETVNREKGYNIGLGGMYATGSQPKGEKNPRAKLTEEEVREIKSRRNEPLYTLYEEYSEKIGYGQFKQIYNDKVWKHIRPTVDPYPYNMEFSLQFTKPALLSYPEVVELRKMWSRGIPPSEAYSEGWKEKVPSFEVFGNIYRGDSYRLVMPEVFTEETSRRIHSKVHSGENNGRAKLTREDVLEIRRRNSKGENFWDIYKDYSKVSVSALRLVINGTTWKNV